MLGRISIGCRRLQRKTLDRCGNSNTIFQYSEKRSEKSRKMDLCLFPCRVIYSVFTSSFQMWFRFHSLFFLRYLIYLIMCFKLRSSLNNGYCNTDSEVIEVKGHNHIKLHCLFITARSIFSDSIWVITANWIYRTINIVLDSTAFQLSL